MPIADDTDVSFWIVRRNAHVSDSNIIREYANNIESKDARFYSQSRRDSMESSVCVCVWCVCCKPYAL